MSKIVNSSNFSLTASNSHSEQWVDRRSFIVWFYLCYLFFAEQDDGVTFVSSSWTFLCCSSMGGHYRHIHSNNVSYVYAHVYWRWSSLWMEKLCLFVRKGLYARQIIFICILCLSLLFQSLLNLNQLILHLIFPDN